MPIILVQILSVFIFKVVKRSTNTLFSQKAIVNSIFIKFHYVLCALYINSKFYYLSKTN